MAFLPQCNTAMLPSGLARYLRGSQAPPIIKKLIEAKWNTDNRHKRRLLSVVRKFNLCQSSFYPTASIWWKHQAPLSPYIAVVFNHLSHPKKAVRIPRWSPGPHLSATQLHTISAVFLQLYQTNHHRPSADRALVAYFFVACPSFRHDKLWWTARPVVVEHSFACHVSRHLSIVRANDVGKCLSITYSFSVYLSAERSAYPQWDSHEFFPTSGFITLRFTIKLEEWNAAGREQHPPFLSWTIFEDIE